MQRNVALRKESVDRNRGIKMETPTFYASLSARRAWIEMPLSCTRPMLAQVALRKESVDRNLM